MKIPIIGNGDVTSPEIAKKMFDTYGVDGIMIGRGTVGKPWIFKHIKHFINSGELLAEPLLDEKVNVAIEHFNRSVEWKGDVVGVLEMRRHLSNYFKGLPNFKEIRMRLLTTKEPAVVIGILEEIREKYKGIEFEGGNEYFRY